MHIFQHSVVVTLLYGSRGWAPTQAQTQRLPVVHMHCLRRTLGITRGNVEVLSRCKEQVMKKQLRQQRLQWLAHCRSMEDKCLTKQVLMVQLPGTRPKGKPPLRWREDVLPTDVHQIGLAGGWHKVAEHSSAWHAAARWGRIIARALPNVEV